MDRQILTSKDLVGWRSDRRIYDLCCQRLGVQPAEVIFLDDAEANVIAACE